MRFLHLADLHIGKTVNGYSMLDEQRHIFAQIIAYVKSERPQAVLMAGDVYDRTLPGAEAVSLFDDLLTELAATGATLLVISGNHDSPERLSFASRLLSEHRLYLHGIFSGAPERVVLHDEFGAVNFWLLPFIKPSLVRGLAGGQEVESYGEALALALATAEFDWRERNVLLSHQFYTGQGAVCQRSESESDPVGGLDAIDVGRVKDFDYVALGHLHRAQRVTAEHIRYCGSPLKYSASEVGNDKVALLVELREKGQLTVTDMPLRPKHDMRQIKGEMDFLTSRAALESGSCDDYMHVILTDEMPLLDARERLRSVYPNLMSCVFSNRQSGIDETALTPDSEQASLSPYDLFDQFFLASNGSVMNELQAKIVRELLEEEE